MVYLTRSAGDEDGSAGQSVVNQAPLDGVNDRWRSMRFTRPTRRGKESVERALVASIAEHVRRKVTGPMTLVVRGLVV